MTSEDNKQRNIPIKKIIKWLGRLLMLLSFIFIIRKIAEYREEIQFQISINFGIQIGISCLIYGFLVYLNPFIYQQILYITTRNKLPYYKVAQTFCKSNLLKYLPGNVMQYIGRNELAIHENLPHSKVALATILEICTVVFSNLLIAAIFSWRYAVEWFNNFANTNVSLILLMSIGALFLCILFIVIFRQKLTAYLKDIISWNNFLRFFTLILYSLALMICNNIIYFHILYLMGTYMEIEYYLIGVGLNSLSFILGYITPGVPGGIGIREAVMVYFFSTFIPEDQILSSAIIFRITTIIGDFIAFGIASIVYKIRNTNHTAVRKPQ